MQIAARFLSNKPMNVTLLGWLHGCTHARSLATPRSRARIGLKHDVAGLVQCRLPHGSLWSGREDRYLRPYPLYNMQPHCCSYLSGAKALLRLHAVIDLVAASWELDQWHNAAFPASWLCESLALPLWARRSVPVQRREKPQHSQIADE